MDTFKFPDEVKSEEPKEEAIEIEIETVDDTPEKDKNRAAMTEPPAEVTEEELASYTSESARKRIQHFSKGYHEERREKEAALREKEEALSFAQKLVEENKKLQASVGKGQQTMLEQAKIAVAKEVDEAKQKYKTAYEDGDTDGVIAAQEALTSAKIKADKINNFRPASAQPQKPLQTQPPQVQQQKPAEDPKINAWKSENPWFGANRKMTAVALAVHQELVESGIETSSPQYLERINSEMREVFPSEFIQEKKKAVVAPVTRSTAPRKIVLTESAVRVAKRLGLTNEQYARAVAEEMRKQNG